MMMVISRTSKGKVFRTLSKGTTSDLWSAMVTTIVQRNGVILRHYKSVSGDSVYIDASFGAITVKVRVSNHSKRINSIGCIKPIKRTTTGYRCEVGSWSSLALVRNLIENL